MDWYKIITWAFIGMMLSFFWYYAFSFMKAFIWGIA